MNYVELLGNRKDIDFWKKKEVIVRKVEMLQHQFSMPQHSAVAASSSISANGALSAV